MGRVLRWAVVAAGVLLLALALSLPPQPPPAPAPVLAEFGKSTHYLRAAWSPPPTNLSPRHQEVLDALIARFYDPASGLFLNFHRDGEFAAERRTVFGFPYNFTERGNDSIAAFNAFVGDALVHGYLRSGNRSYLSLAESLAGAIRREFWNSTSGSYLILRRAPEYEGMVNDAIIASFYLELYEATERPAYAELAREALGSVADRYWTGGGFHCCRIGGAPVDRIFTRDALTVASLAYGYRLTGNATYLQRGEALADYYLARHYDPRGFFHNSTNPGTNAELGLGLLELYALTGNRTYAEAALAVARYWGPRLSPNSTSSVDAAEQLILNTRLHRLLKDGDSLVRAEAIRRGLEELCYSSAFSAYPFNCPGEMKIYYSPIIAIVLLAVS